MFLKIINKTAMTHKVILHDYVLMDNHYHLLIETEKENLSTFMRIVSANYAQYYNRKYQRSGHLWQDRYKSKFITSDEYLYLLIRYIEYNPIEAGLSTKIGEYPHTFASTIFNAKEHYPCSNDSLLIRAFDIKTLGDFLDVPLSEEESEHLQEKQRQKIEKSDEGIKISRSKKLTEHLSQIENRQERDKAIAEAYLDGHTQVSIAEHLGVSRSLVSKVTKSSH